MLQLKRIAYTSKVSYDWLKFIFPLFNSGNSRTVPATSTSKDSCHQRKNTTNSVSVPVSVLVSVSESVFVSPPPPSSCMLIHK